ncbi:hypothetical protein BA78_8898, partial [Aspergillus fumigatus]
MTWLPDTYPQTPRPRPPSPSRHPGLGSDPVGRSPRSLSRCTLKPVLARVNGDGFCPAVIFGGT